MTRKMNHHDFAVVPPMGWNSWDCFGASVREEEVRENARWMAKHLLKYGWEYVVVDIQWYEPTADSSIYHPYVPLDMDAWSRLIPAVNRFPSSVNGRGFKPLSDFVHDLTDDYWDRWEQLLDMFDRCERWYPFVGPGHWPDCDMLPLGHIGIRSTDGGGADRRTRFTRPEQITMMTLWTIFRSPLMFGGQLPDNDEWTTSLLTNPEVLEMHRVCSVPHPVYRDGPHIVWSSKNDNDEVYLALFNTGNTETVMEVSLSQLGITRPQKVRDLWQRTDNGIVSDRYWTEVPAHGAVLIKLYSYT